MLSSLLKEKKYFVRVFGILIVYIIITIILWEKLPDTIYLPLRWDGQRSVGFYEKTILNVIYVFVTPLLGTTLIKMANIASFGKREDLFSMAVTQSLDLLCYLLVILGPLAFIVWSIYHNDVFSYVFFSLVWRL